MPPPAPAKAIPTLPPPTPHYPQIQHFWRDAFLGHPSLRGFFTEDDARVLEAVTHVGGAAAAGILC